MSRLEEREDGQKKAYFMQILSGSGKPESNVCKSAVEKIDARVHVLWTGWQIGVWYLIIVQVGHNTLDQLKYMLY